MRCKIFESSGSFLWTPRDAYKACFPAQTVTARCNGKNHFYTIIHRDGKQTADFCEKCPSAKERFMLKEIYENVGHLTLPPYTELCTLNNFDPNRRQFGHRVYLSDGRVQNKRIGVNIETIKTIVDGGRGLYISGLRRYGKTHLAIGLIQYLFDKDESLSIRVIRVPHSQKNALGLADIFTALARGEDCERESWRMTQINAADLILIDEFAGEKKPGGSTHQNGVLSFIDNCNKQCIFTSNHSIEDLESIGYDPRISGRLKEMCYELTLSEARE